MNDIILIGGGGHCRSVIDSIENGKKYNIVGIIDENKEINSVLGYPVLGGESELKNIYNKGIKYAFICIGSIGYPKIRIKYDRILKELGFELPIIIDKTAIISKHSIIEEGVFIGKNVVVNSNSNIHRNAIINTGCIVEHDNNIGEFVHLAPGVVMSGGVNVGNNSHIGTNSTIIQGINIEENVLVGAGSVIIKNIKKETKVYGNPGREH